jgi:hypothetical protein
MAYWHLFSFPLLFSIFLFVCLLPFFLRLWSLFSFNLKFPGNGISFFLFFAFSLIFVFFSVVCFMCCDSSFFSFFLNASELTRGVSDIGPDGSQPPVSTRGAVRRTTNSVSTSVSGRSNSSFSSSMDVSGSSLSSGSLSSSSGEGRDSSIEELLRRVINPGPSDRPISPIDRSSPIPSATRRGDVVSSSNSFDSSIEIRR